MSKRLEEFIKENRGAFDSYEPSRKIWNTISRKITGTADENLLIKRMPWIKWSAAAAVLILIISTIYYLVPADNQGQFTKVIKADVPAEYAEEVYHFTKIIELKRKELQKLEQEQPELYRQFATDIYRLDSNYQVLRKELPGNPNQELLIDAMIGNLQWQIDVLNQQLIIIQKIKQSKKQTNEKLHKTS
jgi:hypothetical protein